MDRRTFLTRMTGAAIGLVLSPGHAEAADPLRLGYQVNIWGSLSVVALKAGLFEKAGLPVEGIRAPVGRQTRDAMVAERVDLGTFAVPTFLLGVDKGGLVALALAGNAGKTVHILVRPDSPIQSVADLKGKRIATGIGSSTDAVFRTRVAPRFGLTDGSYEPINTLEPDKVGTLVAKQVDASVSTEPFIAIAEEQGLARSLVSFETYDPMPVVLAAAQSVPEKRRDAVVQFLRVWIATARIFQAEGERAADIMTEVLNERGYKLTPSVVRKALSRFDVQVNIGPDFRAYAMAEAEGLLKTGRIKSMPVWETAIRRDLLEQATRG